MEDLPKKFDKFLIGMSDFGRSQSIRINMAWVDPIREMPGRQDAMSDSLQLRRRDFENQVNSPFGLVLVLAHFTC